MPFFILRRVDMEGYSVAFAYVEASELDASVLVILTLIRAARSARQMG